MDAARLEKVVAAAREKFADAADVNAVVKFDFEGEASITVDARRAPPHVEAHSDLDPDCTVIADEETFRALFDGELSPTAAFMGGQMRIEGSMGVAMRLASALS